MTSLIVETIHVFVILLLFVQINTSFGARIGKTTADAAIKDICSKALDPPSCLQILKSDPRAPSQDLNGLAKMAIELAENKVKETITFTNSLKQRTKDTQLKERYDSCNKYFNLVITALGEARRNLVTSGSVSMHSAASDAIEEAENCEDMFEGDPPEPSSLPQKTKDVINHSGVVFAIAQKG